RQDSAANAGWQTSPGQSQLRQNRRRHHSAHRSATGHRSCQDSEAGSTYTFPGPNLTPAETWATGFRAPYGLALSPTGELWEVEHGPRGGDELNLIEK